MELFITLTLMAPFVVAGIDASLRKFVEGKGLPQIRFTKGLRLAMMATGLIALLMAWFLIFIAAPDIRPIISGTEVEGVIEHKGKGKSARGYSSYNIRYSYSTHETPLQLRTSKGRHDVNAIFYSKINEGDIVTVRYTRSKKTRKIRSYVKGSRAILRSLFTILLGCVFFFIGVLSLYLGVGGKNFRRKSATSIWR